MNLAQNYKMEYKIIKLDEKQIEKLEKKLDEYDQNYIAYKIDGSISIGIECDGEIVAGLDACMTAFKILYVSTVFVDEEYRKKGLGKALINQMEKEAKLLGANMIRLDTFSWQGCEFYEILGYEKIGYYSNAIDNFEEYFFVKRI